MYLSSTSEVSVESSGNDVRYLFPARPLGNWRLIGLFPIGFSALFLLVSGMLRTMVRDLSQLSHSQHPGSDALSLAFSLLFVVMGSIPACLGLLIMFGRCRIDWRNERLSVTDYAGPIR